MLKRPPQQSTPSQGTSISKRQKASSKQAHQQVHVQFSRTCHYPIIPRMMQQGFGWSVSGIPEDEEKIVTSPPQGLAPVGLLTHRVASILRSSSSSATQKPSTHYSTTFGSGGRTSLVSENYKASQMDDQEAHSSPLLFWSDQSITPTKCAQLQQSYCIGNHFPGIEILSRKLSLAHILMKYHRHFPHHFDFFPESFTSWSMYCDEQKNEINEKEEKTTNAATVEGNDDDDRDNEESTMDESSRQHVDAAAKKRTIKKKKSGSRSWYICKPTSGCQGQGIVLVSKITPSCFFASQLSLQRKQEEDEEEQKRKKSIQKMMNEKERGPLPTSSSQPPRAGTAGYAYTRLHKTNSNCVSLRSYGSSLSPFNANQITTGDASPSDDNTTPTHSPPKQQSTTPLHSTPLSSSGTFTRKINNSTSPPNTTMIKRNQLASSQQNQKTTTIQPPRNMEEMVVQRYIPNPFLIAGGRKCDLRCYVLVTSFNPLEVYFHCEGLVRLCREIFQPPTEENKNCKKIHLANYSINKTPTTKTQGGGEVVRHRGAENILGNNTSSKNGDANVGGNLQSSENTNIDVIDDGGTSFRIKESFEFLEKCFIQYLQERPDVLTHRRKSRMKEEDKEGGGETFATSKADNNNTCLKEQQRIHNEDVVDADLQKEVEFIWKAIHRVIVATLLVAQDSVIKTTPYSPLYQTHNANSAEDTSSFSSEKMNSPSFEILGFDIMLDEQLKPWLIEVNHSPSWNTDMSIDKEVKSKVLYDALNIVRQQHLPPLILRRNRMKKWTNRKKKCIRPPSSTTTASSVVGDTPTTTNANTKHSLKKPQNKFSEEKESMEYEDEECEMCDYPKKSSSSLDEVDLLMRKATLASNRFQKIFPSPVLSSELADLVKTQQEVIRLMLGQ